MLRKLLKYLIVVLIIISAALSYSNIYNFIINYHIIIYLVLLLLPLSSVVTRSLTIPFLVFIQFFWAALSLAALSMLPLYQILIWVKIIFLWLSKVIAYFYSFLKGLSTGLIPRIARRFDSPKRQLAFIVNYKPYLVFEPV